jgi:hypothetical protein
VWLWRLVQFPVVVIGVTAVQKPAVAVVYGDTRVARSVTAEPNQPDLRYRPAQFE